MKQKEGDEAGARESTEKCDFNKEIRHGRVQTEFYLDRFTNQYTNAVCDTGFRRSKTASTLGTYQSG